MGEDDTLNLRRARALEQVSVLVFYTIRYSTVHKENKLPRAPEWMSMT